MRKNLILAVLLMVSLLLIASAYSKTFEKEDGKLKVGGITYTLWTMEDLLEKRAEIEADYQEATERYNEQMVEINELISEAEELEVE